MIFCLQTAETLQSILKADITPLTIPQINCKVKSIFVVVSGLGFFETIKFEWNLISSQSSKNVPFEYYKITFFFLWKILNSISLPFLFVCNLDICFPNKYVQTSLPRNFITSSASIFVIELPWLSKWFEILSPKCCPSSSISLNIIKCFCYYINIYFS